MDGDNKPALVALRTRREQVIEALSEHFARDALDLDEFEDRVNLAHRATAVAELDRLLADLEPLEAAPAETALAPAPAPDTALAAHRPDKKWIVGIFGGADRKGAWTVPRKMTAVAVCGGVDIDFREVALPPGVTELHVAAVMGGVDIIVPPTLAVDCSGLGILGGFDGVDRAPATPDPDAPVLRITGFALMGGVDVVTRLPGESGWQAYWRRRRERKAMRARALAEREEQQRQLGAGRDKKRLTK